MSVWGTFSGGGVGLAVGGPIGGLIGAVAGHYLFDRGDSLFGRPTRETILLTGLIALAAKMAKADGVVLSSEVEAFERIVVVPERDRAAVNSLFRLAGATTAGSDAYARQLASAFSDDPVLLEHVVEGLFLIAAADGAVHEAELAYLRSVSELLGQPEARFEAMLERHVRRCDDPYLELGADPDWSDEALRAHHRRLVQDHHPDREIARGLPAEAVLSATARLAAINAAWDRVRRERSL